MFDVVLVDDHRIMRDGIRAILKGSPEFRVVAEAETGAQATRLCLHYRPQIVLMDLHLPELGGVEASAEILRHAPETKIVILSMYDDEESVVSAIRTGCRAFVLKTAGDADLLDALRTVAKGGSYLSPRISDKFFSRIQKGNLDTPAKTSVQESLTPREQQVMRLIAEGKTSKEVAASLDLSVETVRSYRKALMKKLQVNNVAALTHIAISEGIARPVRH